MVSPRRSSRARSTAHPPPLSHPQSSSSISSASSTRSRHQKHHDDSPTDLDVNFSRGTDTTQTAFESLPEPTAPASTTTADDEVDEAGSQEDEITRCVCGFQEYPGGDDDQADTDGLFIQCDTCHVWQHSFCVSITDNAVTPDNYYCELCKPEFHKLGTNKAGTQVSLYLPIHPEPIEPTHHKDHPHKRRTTMNSRDADYDEEILKKVLEDSKFEQKVGTSTRGTSSRARKRGTSEGSDEQKQDSKRQRTSHSPDTASNVAVESADEKPARATVVPSSSKKARGAAARVSNAASAAAGKRTSARNRGGDKNKASRKDDSEHSDEYPSLPVRTNGRGGNKPATEDIPHPQASVEVVPETPQQPTKRGGRNSHANGGGRRRPNNRHNSRRQSEDIVDGNTTAPLMSRDLSIAGSNTHHNSSKVDNSNGIVDRPTKPRVVQSRMSINEMKKRVNGISDFITRTQIEMATSSKSDIYAYIDWMEEKGTPLSNITTPKSLTSKTPTPTSASTINSVIPEKAVPQIQVNGSTGQVLERATEMLADELEPGALEMMELLSGKINRWQQTYGEKI